MSSSGRTSRRAAAASSSPRADDAVEKPTVAKSPKRTIPIPSAPGDDDGPTVRADNATPKSNMKTTLVRVQENDPSLQIIDFSGKITFSNEYAVKYAAALRDNTHVRELHLANANVITSGGKALGEMLAVNKSLRVLNVEKNKIMTEGLEVIGAGLKTNTTLQELNLFQNAEPGTAACEAFIDSLQRNITLLKVSWRITSRQSFAINKMITRNNEIVRRRREGKPFDDLLPDEMKE